MPDANLSEQRKKFMFYSTVNSKFTDTRLGGNYALNMPPGNTEFSDLSYVSPGLRTSGRDASDGMGRYYSEAIDDNAMLVHFQFGIPNLSGMISFFNGFYDGEMSYIAHTGRKPGLLYYAGYGIGLIATLHPGVIGLMLAAHTLRFLAQEPSGKYYTLKPSMGTFWLRASTIANIIAVNKYITQPLFDMSEVDTYTSPDAANLNNSAARKSYREALNQIAPDIFDSDGSINVLSIATRTQRIANKHEKYLSNIMNEGSDIATTLARIEKYNDGLWTKDDLESVEFGSTEHPVGSREYYEEWSKDLLNNYNLGDKDKLLEESIRAKFVGDRQSTDAAEDAYNKEVNSRLGKSDGLLSNFTEGYDRFKELFAAHQRDGNAWLTLKVDYIGQTSTTFSNEVGDPEIRSAINNKSRENREARFSVQDFKTGVGAIDEVTNGIKSVAAGLMDAVHVSGLMALMGSALVDIQKIWKDSSVSLPQATFTIKSRPWSGDPYTVFMDQDLIFAVLLAGVLPISTGRSSYTAPLYCSCFSRGKIKISEGLITDLTVTRGASNVTNTEDWRDLGLDFTFTVTDLSSIVHAPISDSFSLGQAAVAGLAGGLLGGPLGALGGAAISTISNSLNNEGKFLDILASYSGLSLADTYYSSRRLNLALTRKWANVKDRFTMEAQLGLAFNSSIVRFTFGALAQAGARAVD
jgi:hypothetical protein